MTTSLTFAEVRTVEPFQINDSFVWPRVMGTSWRRLVSDLNSLCVKSKHLNVKITVMTSYNHVRSVLYTRPRCDLSVSNCLWFKQLTVRQLEIM